MKRKFHHPEPSARELAGPKYWRSLDELAETPGFKTQLAREFPEGASAIEGVDRRQFTKIMAASFALGGLGLAGCRRPEQYVLPFGKSVEGVIQGLPLYFATAMPLRKSAIPLLAETHMGRPTKLEGNPSYAPHGGASSLLAQASVLDLYDPDRATKHTIKGQDATSDQVTALLADLGKTAAAEGGEGLAFLAEESSSPTRARLLATLKQKFPRAIWAEYEPVQDEPPAAAARAAFGRDVKPLYQFAKAKRIVSLEADFFHAESGGLYYAREFAKGRRVTKPEDPMNRLYVVESGLSLTGSMADHRLRLASSHLAAFAAALAGKVMGSPLDSLAQGLEFKDQEKWLTACADDLRAHRGECLVVAGAHQPAVVHAIAYALNSFLGNLGTTVDFVDVVPSGASSLAALATAIRGGSVKTLIVLGGNPVYNAPAELEWGKLQESVPEVIRVGYYVDETSVKAGTHIASAHYLESWGDARTLDGTIVPVQPMILPLFNGLTEIEILCHLLGEAKTDPYAQVYATITGLDPKADAEKTFRQFLHDGLLAGTAYPKAAVRFDSNGVAGLFASPPKVEALSARNLEVRFITDHKLDDGRFANNGWLQECPDPITRISWDNPIQISPRFARELGVYPAGEPLLQVARVEEGDLDAAGKENAHIGEVTVGGRKIRGPLHIQPGLSNYTVVLPLGYGRTVCGHVGRNAGYNAYALRTSDTTAFATGAVITLTGERMLLANTQTHWSMEGRDLIREANYDGPESYREKPDYVKEVGMESETPSTIGEVGEAMTPAQRATEIPRGNSLYSTPKFDGIHQWGMSIDLNTCIGCHACVIACQAENNIPIVGKDQALRGREMHWIRLDRYYSDGQLEGSPFGGPKNHFLPEDPQVSLQPVACQQCELAPCEMVCPVNATVHDSEGINVMAYNRCIGTRYCANNCPYKVRRFNFFDFNLRHLDSLYLSQLGPKGMPELVQMVKNPEVTVRMRGVMEKCTYCVQRIENAKIRHKVQVMREHNGAPVTVEELRVPDGTIKTACQQACPVDAIVFGNILDTDSLVSVAKRRAQDYQLLAYLNTRPRTSYLGKLRNPNPQMPDYATLPLSRQEHFHKNHPSSQGEQKPGEPAALATRKHLGGLS